MAHATVDDRGRLYLPKDVREQFGDQYRIVQLKDGVKLVPVAEDPVEGLREALDGLRDVPKEEIDSVAERRGREEARDALR